ncbi:MULTISPECIES: DUF547 domain-containing protein [unclassified Variovorax]|uniref:DUF547 domain-containing protein n=1 Tax=unclassified Variovorax TaxID=663243 RepID=UPI003ECD0862
MKPTRRTAMRAGAGAAAAMIAPWSLALDFDHAHAAWTSLLRKHVVLLRGGAASRVHYSGFASDRAALKRYLDELSTVTESAFSGFGKPQQQAFLLNAYNAFTVELVLTKYRGLKTIKDLGNLLSSPWTPKWIPLLGTSVSLDDIEHEMLRARGRYDDPRVHFALNCASIGCPMLREEAYVAERLDAQLEQQTRRFLSDRARNRFNEQRDRIELSKVFDWYGADSRLGHHGIGSLTDLAARYAELPADSPAHRERIRGGKVGIVFIDYDWALNDTL